MTKKQFDVFVSHANPDSSSAAHIVRALEEKGLRVWTDKTQQATQSEAEFVDQLENALITSGSFVFVMSPSALASPTVNFELGVAVGRSHNSRQTPIVSVLVDDLGKEKLPAPLRTRTVIDARNAAPGQMAAELTASLKHQ